MSRDNNIYVKISKMKRKKCRLKVKFISKIINISKSFYKNI